MVTRPLPKLDSATFLRRHEDQANFLQAPAIAKHDLASRVAAHADHVELLSNLKTGEVFFYYERGDAFILHHSHDDKEVSRSTTGDEGFSAV